MKIDSITVEQLALLAAHLRAVAPAATLFFDGTSVTIPDEFAAAAQPFIDSPPTALPADVLCAQVDALRDSRLAAGFADATTGKTFACDGESLTKWGAIGASAGLAIALNSQPAPTFDLIAADNSTVTLSAAETFALLNGRVMPWVSATVLYARNMKNGIVGGVAQTVIAAGWP